MSTEENKALSRQWREEFDKGNWAVLDEFIAPNVVMHFAGSPEPGQSHALCKYQYMVFSI